MGKKLKLPESLEILVYNLMAKACVVIWSVAQSWALKPKCIYHFTQCETRFWRKTWSNSENSLEWIKTIKKPLMLSLLMVTWPRSLSKGMTKSCRNLMDSYPRYCWFLAQPPICASRCGNGWGEGPIGLWRCDLFNRRSQSYQAEVQDTVEAYEAREREFPFQGIVGMWSVWSSVEQWPAVAHLSYVSVFSRELALGVYYQRLWDPW